MFDVLTVQEAFLGMVGWRKHPNPAETNNPMGDMLTSSSGVYFNDQHPLLTIENFKNIFPVFSRFDYAAWDNGYEYSKGDMVLQSSRYYVSVVDSNTNHAVTDADYWRETTPFNEELRKITTAASTKVINDWLALKDRLRSASNLLKKSQVLNIPGYKGVEFDSKDWIGWRIVPSPTQDVIVTIDRIGLYLKDSQDCVIGLFQNGSSTPVRTTTILGEGTSDPIWKQVNWELQRGNFYYLAYQRSEIGDAVPVNGIYNMTKNWSYNRFPGILPYAEVSAFEHDGPGEPGWEDVTDIQVNDNNYGLNLMISARCDYTDLIIDHKNLFINSWAKAVAISALKAMAFNPDARINRNENNIDPSRIMYEIEGDTQGRKGGLRLDYEDSLKAISFDDRKFSEHCMPCKRSGIRQLAT